MRHGNAQSKGVRQRPGPVPMVKEALGACAGVRALARTQHLLPGTRRLLISSRSRTEGFPKRAGTLAEGRGKPCDRVNETQLHTAASTLTIVTRSEKVLTQMLVAGTSSCLSHRRENTETLCKCCTRMVYFPLVSRLVPSQLVQKKKKKLRGGTMHFE